MLGWQLLGLAAAVVIIVTGLAVIVRPTWRNEPITMGAAGTAVVVGLIAVAIGVRQLS